MHVALPVWLAMAMNAWAMRPEPKLYMRMDVGQGYDLPNGVYLCGVWYGLAGVMWMHPWVGTYSTHLVLPV